MLLYVATSPIHEKSKAKFKQIQKEKIEKE
jgi:hypothetical protein